MEHNGNGCKSVVKGGSSHDAGLNWAVVWNSLLWLVGQLSGELAVEQWVAFPSADSSVECSVDIGMVTGNKKEAVTGSKAVEGGIMESGGSCGDCTNSWRVTT